MTDRLSKGGTVLLRILAAAPRLGLQSTLFAFRSLGWRMLATLPSAAPEQQTSSRPAKDKAAFFSLLPPAVEFVEGSSSGALVVGNSKLVPINASPASAQPEV
jgi:hypothetical protein